MGLFDHALDTVQVRHSASQPMDPVETSSAERPRTDVFLDDQRRTSGHRDHFVKRRCPQVGIDRHTATECPLTGLGHARCYGRGRLCGSSSDQLVDRRSVDPYGDVEPIKEGSRQATGIALVCRLATTARSGSAALTAGAGIHGPHQNESSRKGCRTAGPADPHLALFERLAESVENDGRELSHLIEEQDSAWALGREL